MNDEEYWSQRLNEFLDYVRDNAEANEAKNPGGLVADLRAVVGQWTKFTLEQQADPSDRAEDDRLLAHWVTGVKDLVPAAQASYRARVRRWWTWCEDNLGPPSHPSDSDESSEDDVATWMERLDAYVRWRGAIGRAPATLDTVRSVLHLWIPWALDQGVDPGQFDDADIVAFCDSRDGINSDTRRSYSGHIRRWRERLPKFERAQVGITEVSNCWMVRAGREGEAVEHNLDNEVVTIGWGDWGDWSSVAIHESRDEFSDFIDERFAEQPTGKRRSAREQIWRFAREIQIGDLVVMPMRRAGAEGNPIAVGRIDGPFEFDPNQSEYLRLRRSIAWLRTGIERHTIGEDLQNSLGGLRTVFGLHRHDAARRIHHLAEHGVDPGNRRAESNEDVGGEPELPRDHLAVALGKAADDLLCGVEFLHEVVELLQDKGQVILYGPPGTGKTYFAQRLAQALAVGSTTTETDDEPWLQRLAAYCLHLEQDQGVQPGTHRSIARRWIEFALERDLDPSVWDEALYTQFADLNPDWQEITRKTHRYDLRRWCSWAASGAVSLVQFHPAYSYEDFFEGIRPRIDGKGQMIYELTPGPLVQLAERAQNHPDELHVMVIDEINRANLPRVLGELLYLLEYRNESIQTQYRPDGSFRLPKNVWFIGTMNTADRSIALIDAAMRRRFHFVPFFPDREPTSGLLRKWCGQKASRPMWVADLLDGVNQQLRDDLRGDYLLIGPSHVMKEELDKNSLRQIWKYNIEPLIEDQFFGQQDVIDKFRFDAVWKQHGPDAATSTSEADKAGEPGEEAQPTSDHAESQSDE